MTSYPKLRIRGRETPDGTVRCERCTDMGRPYEAVPADLGETCPDCGLLLLDPLCVQEAIAWHEEEMARLDQDREWFRWAQDNLALRP